MMSYERNDVADHYSKSDIHWSLKDVALILNVSFNPILQVDVFSNFCEIDPSWMQQDRIMGW